MCLHLKAMQYKHVYMLIHILTSSWLRSVCEEMLSGSVVVCHSRRSFDPQTSPAAGDREKG